MPPFQPCKYAVDHVEHALTEGCSTGVHIIAATFLLPVGVVMYTFVGGIKATFLTDYFHTFVITVVICFFTIKVWLTPEISSPAALWEIITQLAVDRPVAGNHGGSYLTMTSKNVRSRSTPYFCILVIC